MVTFQPQTKCEVCGRGFLDLFWVVAKATQATWITGFCYSVIDACVIAIKNQIGF